MPGPSNQEYFAALAQRVSDGLAACGYPYCTGAVMATNPTWRQPLSQWKRVFSAWMQTPEPEAVLASSIFFDSPAPRPEGLFSSLQEHVLGLAPRQTAFLAHLAKSAVSNRPPLGFFRGFVLEDKGEHADTLNLKRKGIGPIVDLARVHALASGVPQVNTQARLAAVAASGRLSTESVADLGDALEFHRLGAVRHQRPGAGGEAAGQLPLPR